MSLQDKVAIVTGASSGIGAAIAVKLTEEGAQVVIVARNQHKLKDTSNICKTRGLEPLTIFADVAVYEDLKNIIDKTLSAFGKLDILVNNAGIHERFSILDNSAMSVFDRVMSTNLHAAVYLTHLAADHLSASKGNIVNIASIYSHNFITSGSNAYASSKAGLNQFTKCVAKDFAAKGVRVNVVCPGIVKVDRLAKMYSVNYNQEKPSTEDVWNLIGRKTPLNKVSEPEEIADLVAYISSEKGRSFTGSSIVIDNGMLVESYLK